MAPRKDAKAPVENAPSGMEIEEEQPQLKAKRTLCYYAFDTLMHYFGQMEQRPELDFSDVICAFCIQWKAKSGTRGNKIQLEPVSLKKSFAEKIIALLKGEKKPITLEEGIIILTVPPIE